MTAIWAGAIASAPVGAQQVPWVAFDVGVGAGHGFGGPKTDDRGIYVISVNLSVAVHRRANNAIVLTSYSSVRDSWRRVGSRTATAPWPSALGCVSGLRIAEELSHRQVPIAERRHISRPALSLTG